MVCRGLSWNAVATQLRRQCSRGLEKWLDRIPAGGCSCLTASNTYVICMVMGLWQGLCHVHIQIVFLLLVPVLSEIIIEALGDTVFGNMTLGSFRVPIYSYLIVYLSVTCWWERRWYFFWGGFLWGIFPKSVFISLIMVSRHMHNQYVYTVHCTWWITFCFVQLPCQNRNKSWFRVREIRFLGIAALQGMRELKQTGYLQQNLRHTVGYLAWIRFKTSFVIL